jgi:hypothetical protein
MQMQNKDQPSNLVKKACTDKKVVFEVIYKRKDYTGM